VRAFRISAAWLALALAAHGADAPKLIVTPFHASGLYETGEPAGWSVTLPEGADAPDGGYTCEIRKNNLDTVAEGRAEVLRGPGNHRNHAQRTGDAMGRPSW